MYTQTRHQILLLVLAVAVTLQAGARVCTAAEPPAGKAAGERRARTRDEELYELEARQAQLALDQAKVEMEQAKLELEETKTLYDEKLVTIDKLNQATQKYDRAILKHEQAKIDLKKKRLEFLKDATLITVADATKYRDDEGQIIASVKLRNDSDISKARIAMEGVEQLSDDRLASLLKVHNVIVTLRGEVEMKTGTGLEERRYTSGKAIVGDPFQQIVPELKYGQEIVLKYRLLKRDIENVTVSVELAGAQKDYDVFLKKESQQDLPTVSSTQYSLVGKLGEKVRYDLTLERLAKTEQSFSLIVLNLPQEIRVDFLDPSSEATLTQVKFTEELSKQSLYLEVSVPEKLSPKLVDANISFYIMVARQAELKRIFEIKTQFGGNVPDEEIAKLKGNKVDLVLIPRGVGKLEILVPNLFKEVSQGEPVTIKFNLLNSGTLALRRVKPELDLPLEWESELIPAEAEVINGGEKALFKAELRPPQDVAVGEYTVRMKAEGHSGVDIADAVDKDFTVRIVAQSSITGTAVLVTVLVVLVIGIAVASIKISRR